MKHPEVTKWWHDLEQKPQWYYQMPPRLLEGGYIYKAWGQGSRCLYVGQTISPALRMAVHISSGSLWLPHAEKVTWITLDDWELNRAELSAIRVLNPVYNIYGKNKDD